MRRRLINTKRVTVEFQAAHDKVWAYELNKLPHVIRLGVISSGDMFVGVTAFVLGRWLLQVAVTKRLDK